MSKPPKTYREQLEILKNRGLLITDEQRALHCLEHHNYYRLCDYRHPLTMPGNRDQFLPDSTFNDLWNLYHFDRALRQLISEATKCVEISLRARWSYVLGHLYGPHAYEKPGVFRTPSRHAKALEELDKQLQRSEEPFAGHYSRKYSMSRPPIWAACEVMSFGLLSRFYENIARDSDKKEIARTYHFSFGNFKSLLEHCVYLRNICAHHSRLWNRQFTIAVQLPRTTPARVIPDLHPTESRRLYNTLVLLVHMVLVIDPAANWPERLSRHLGILGPQHLHLMGFPADWRDRSLWKRLAVL